MDVLGDCAGTPPRYTCKQNLTNNDTAHADPPHGSSDVDFVVDPINFPCGLVFGWGYELYLFQAQRDNLSLSRD